MPNSNAENFYILLHLGDGAFGRAYLASTGTAVCVLKCPLGSLQCDFRNEALLWQQIWEIKQVRVTKLVNEEVLILPYLKMCTGGIEVQTDEVKEAVKEAVNLMVSKGYQHEECYWRHVGLCWHSNKLKAIFIDLGNVKKIDQQDSRAVATARKTMLTELGLLQTAAV